MGPGGPGALHADGHGGVLELRPPPGAPPGEPPGSPVLHGFVPVLRPDPHPAFGCGPGRGPPGAAAPAVGSLPPRGLQLGVPLRARGHRVRGPLRGLRVHRPAGCQAGGAGARAHPPELVPHVGARLRGGARRPPGEPLEAPGPRRLHAGGVGPGPGPGHELPDSVLGVGRLGTLLRDALGEPPGMVPHRRGHHVGPRGTGRPNGAGEPARGLDGRLLRGGPPHARGHAPGSRARPGRGGHRGRGRRLRPPGSPGPSPRRGPPGEAEPAGGGEPSGGEEPVDRALVGAP